MTFPTFVDADVYIYFSATRKYALHRKVLIHNSLTLSKLLTLENATTVRLTSNNEDVCKEWLLQLKYPTVNGGLGGSGELIVLVCVVHDPFFLICPLQPNICEAED